MRWRRSCGGADGTWFVDYVRLRFHATKRRAGPPDEWVPRSTRWTPRP